MTPAARRARKVANREHARLERRRALARQSAIQYEDRLNDQELQLIRLDATPEELQETNHEDVLEETVKQIESMKVMIERMYEEAGPEPVKVEGGDGSPGGTPKR